MEPACEKVETIDKSTALSALLNVLNTLDALRITCLEHLSYPPASHWHGDTVSMHAHIHIHIHIHIHTHIHIHLHAHVHIHMPYYLACSCADKTKDCKAVLARSSF